MNVQTYGKLFVEKYGNPFTEEEPLLCELGSHAMRVASLYENWGNPVDEFKDVMDKVLHTVVEANRELMDAAGVMFRHFSPKHHLVSPEIDFRHIEELRTRGDIVEYHTALLKDISTELMWTATDAIGREEIYTFPIYYDIWIQAVLTQEDALTILRRIERGY